MYPKISFKRSLVYTSVLTALTVTFTSSVYADGTVDPTKNSDIQLIQSNQSNAADRNKADNLAYINSQGQGGVVLKGADASGIVQQIMPDLVNRGNATEFLSNVLDLTVNNDNVNSQNTFYISQIGGSWLVMNVDGENNMVKIADLAGIGFENANAQNASEDNAPAEATKINIAGDHNDLTLTPSTVGNIARKMQIIMDKGQGLNQYNVINISYSDFSDIIANLSNASHSTIDVTQSDFSGAVEDVSVNPNIVFIDVVDADNTTVVLNQIGLGNTTSLNIANDFNTVNLSQDNQTGQVSNQADINVDGYNNTITAEQSLSQTAYLGNKLDIDVVNGDNNTISVMQGNRDGDVYENTNASVYVSGSDNKIDISQSTNDFYGGIQQISLSVQGDNNAFMMSSGFDWIDLTANIDGYGNSLFLDNVVENAWGDLYGFLEITGIDNDVHARLNNGYISFDRFEIFGTNNEIQLGNYESGMRFENFWIEGMANTFIMDTSLSYSTLESTSVLGEANRIDIHNQNSSLRLNTDVLGRDNQFNLSISSVSDDYYHWGDNLIDTSIHGSLNRVDVRIEPLFDIKDYDYYRQTINTSVDGLANLVSLRSHVISNSSELAYDLNVDGHHNRVIVDNYSMKNVDLNLDMIGNGNSIQFNSDIDHSVDQIADIDMTGDSNRLLLNPSISNSIYLIEGNNNFVSMEGHADELSASNMSLVGDDNLIEMDVAGLNGTVNINVLGDNNAMGFVLGAGNLEYSLTGSDFIGSVQTQGAAYYQQIERLGTGFIEMRTDAGIVNIASNCGQTCGNAI